VQRYAWILPVASPVAFAMAWGMGANELSSNWGNVYGSRIMKLWQIVIIASIFEFVGAIALGSGVASTIRGSILSTSSYAAQPEVLMFGMLCVVVTCSVWLYIANKFELPISDSQTTVLSLIGVGLASRGWGGIRWSPGFSNIGITWAVSPPMSAAMGFCLFFLFKFFILKHDDAVKRAKLFFPMFMFLILAALIHVSFSPPRLEEDNMTPGSKAGVASGAALIVTIIAQLTYARWLFRKVDEVESIVAHSNAEEQSLGDDKKAGDGLTLDKSENLQPVNVTASVAIIAQIIQPRKFDRIERRLLSNKYTAFLVDDAYARETGRDKHLAHVHEVADRYPAGVELMFSHLLIVTACFKSFAHGASDVSNAAGPLAAIVNILSDGMIDSQSSIPFWTLGMCAAGMAIGILTFAAKPLTMLAVKVTRISPVRGVCIDLASAAVIILATYLKIPVSTTQITVFAIVGVGLATGIRDKIHWVNLGVVVLGWAVTLVFSALVSFSLTAFALRAP
ncbi:phosphate transporter, partial [Gonapodya prolifera JEL478]